MVHSKSQHLVKKIEFSSELIYSKTFKLAALKVGNLACENILAPFILVN